MYTPNAYRHKVFNPSETTLQDICDKEPMESHWILYKVIEINPVERVAIFVVNR